MNIRNSNKTLNNFFDQEDLKKVYSSERDKNSIENPEFISSYFPLEENYELIGKNLTHIPNGKNKFLNDENSKNNKKSNISIGKKLSKNKDNSSNISYSQKNQMNSNFMEKI